MDNVISWEQRRRGAALSPWGVHPERRSVANGVLTPSQSKARRAIIESMVISEIMQSNASSKKKPYEHPRHSADHPAAWRRGLWISVRQSLPGGRRDSHCHHSCDLAADRTHLGTYPPNAMTQDTSNHAGCMIGAAPTSREARSRRASRAKPKVAFVKCAACGGTGEVSVFGQHALRCTVCFGSGFAQYSAERQMNAFEP